MNASSFIDNAVPGTRYFDGNRTNPVGTSTANSDFNTDEKELLNIYMNKAPDKLGRTGQRYVHAPAEMPYDINEGMNGGSKAPVAPMGPPRPAQSAFTGGGPSVAYMEAPTQQNYATVDPFNIFGNRNGAALDAGYFAGRKAPDKPGLDYSAF